MIIGGDKSGVIENIKKYANEGELNHKVELGDPALSDEESEQAIDKFYAMRKNKIAFFFKSLKARLMTKTFERKMDKSIEVVGLEKIRKLKGGVIITSNHFNPLDSFCPRKVARKGFGKTPHIVVQDTNLAMPELLGYLFNHLDVVPIRKSPQFILKRFMPELKRLLKKGECILIYPEEEMWFNYRKPRPCKRGTYMFAAEAGVPVVPCFVEMIDLEEPDNEQFNQVRYVVHVLDPIFPDADKSDRENSKRMAEQDYAERKAAYEEAYGKKLNYKFSYDDIAGWRGKN